jgi:hypothetical protein
MTMSFSERRQAGSSGATAATVGEGEATEAMTPGGKERAGEKYAVPRDKAFSSQRKTADRVIEAMQEGDASMQDRMDKTEDGRRKHAELMEAKRMDRLEAIEEKKLEVFKEIFRKREGDLAREEGQRAERESPALRDRVQALEQQTTDLKVQIAEQGLNLEKQIAEQGEKTVHSILAALQGRQ